MEVTVNYGIIDYSCAEHTARLVGIPADEAYDLTSQVGYALWPWVPDDVAPAPPMAAFPSDVAAVAVFLAMAAELIQYAMHSAQRDLMEGKPNSHADDLEKYRQLVSAFSDTARHLVQPMFAPAHWPASSWHAAVRQ
jgi:hypothetical protein